MNRFLKCFVISPLLALACSGSATAPDTEQPLLLTFAEIQQQILAPNCIDGCHSDKAPLGGLNLNAGKSYSQLVNVPAARDTTFMRVEPGHSSRSYLMFTLRGSNDASLMPPKPLAALTEEEIQAIAGWIDRGAPND